MTFIDNRGCEFNAIIEDMKANNDIVDLKRRIKDCVTGYIEDCVTEIENNNIDSSVNVKNICADAFAHWLYLLNS